MVKESKASLLTLLAWPSLPSGCACPYLYPEFFPGRADESNPCHCQSTVVACDLLRLTLAEAFVFAWRRTCTRSPDVPLQAVSNILDSNNQSWETDGSLHCRQGEVTNYIYVLFFLLRMRVAISQYFRFVPFLPLPLALHLSVLPELHIYFWKN